MLLFEVPESEKPQYDPYEEGTSQQTWTDKLESAVYRSMANYQTIYDSAFTNRRPTTQSRAKTHHGYNYIRKRIRGLPKRYQLIQDTNWTGYAKIDVPSLGNYAF